MSEVSILILSKTIQTTGMPDIRGFVEAMKEMGAQVSTTGHTIVIKVGKGEYNGSDSRENRDPGARGGTPENSKGGR